MHWSDIFEYFEKAVLKCTPVLIDSPHILGRRTSYMAPTWGLILCGGSDKIICFHLFHL